MRIRAVYDCAVPVVAAVQGFSSRGIGWSATPTSSSQLRTHLRAPEVDRGHSCGDPSRPPRATTSDARAVLHRLDDRRPPPYTTTARLPRRSARPTRRCGTWNRPMRSRRRTPASSDAPKRPSTYRPGERAPQLPYEKGFTFELNPRRRLGRESRTLRRGRRHVRDRTTTRCGSRRDRGRHDNRHRGWGHAQADALVNAILRSPVRDLTVVSFGGPGRRAALPAGQVRELALRMSSLDSIPYDVVRESLAGR